MYYWYEFEPPMSVKQTGYVRVNSDASLSWFQQDESNSDYQQYLEWLEEGNSPEPWQPE